MDAIFRVIDRLKFPVLIAGQNTVFLIYNQKLIDFRAASCQESVLITLQNVCLQAVRQQFHGFIFAGVRRCLRGRRKTGMQALKVVFASQSFNTGSIAV